MQQGFCMPIAQSAQSANSNISSQFQILLLCLGLRPYNLNLDNIRLKNFNTIVHYYHQPQQQ